MVEMGQLLDVNGLVDYLLNDLNAVFFEVAKEKEYFDPVFRSHESQIPIFPLSLDSVNSLLNSCFEST